MDHDFGYITCTRCGTLLYHPSDPNPPADDDRLCADTTEPIAAYKIGCKTYVGWQEEAKPDLLSLLAGVIADDSTFILSDFYKCRHWRTAESFALGNGYVRFSTEDQRFHVTRKGKRWVKSQKVT